jgi:S-formylglutathione hydrolase FrmB
MTTKTLAADVSLTHGWLPIAVQAIATVVVLLSLGRGARRWWTLWVPVAVVVGVIGAVVVRWYIGHQGWTGDAPPFLLWLWVALTGLAVTLLVAGWRGMRWSRRAVSLLATPMALICAALVLNQWLAYLPTVGAAWDRATGAPLSGETDQAGVSEMQRAGTAPAKGTIVSVDIPDAASGFKHRKELVYLPPAWYASNPPPRLPAVVMIHAEFGHPNDWLVGGHARKTLDDFAAAHGGNAPVVVFADASGTFSNDTECVNGVRGNAADHITKDVVPFVISNFGVSQDPANWGIAGWSAGGTCAVTLAVKYPEIFSTFVDIDGQKGPYAGTPEQTVARLFGGDTAAWADFDPRTIMERHGPYTGVSGWFGVSTDNPTVYRDGSSNVGAELPPEPDAKTNATDPTAVANYMCELVSIYGIECAVVPQIGGHDFVNAGAQFEKALPWLAGQLGTPGVPEIVPPGAPAS